MSDEFKLDPMETRAKNVVTINKVKKDIPFCTRYFNRPSVDTIIDSPTCTDTSLKESTDINVIVAKHTISGIPLPSIDKALYNLTADGQLVGEVANYTVTLTDKLIKAKQHFMTLPSGLRYQFNNDVSQFADFLSNSSDTEINGVLKQYGLKQDELTPSVDKLQSIPSHTNGDTHNSVSPEG